MLNEGTKFEMPSLRETMRHMKLVSVSDCSSLIEGQRRDGSSEPWKPFRYHISNSVMVEPTDKFSDDDLQSKRPQKESSNEAKPKRGRGRPSKTKVAFKDLVGVSDEFTVRSLLDNNDLKEYEAHNLVRSAVANGTAKQVREVKGGRGKPQKVYKLV